MYAYGITSTTSPTSFFWPMEGILQATRLDFSDPDELVVSYEGEPRKIIPEDITNHTSRSTWAGFATGDPDSEVFWAMAAAVALLGGVWEDEGKNKPDPIDLSYKNVLKAYLQARIPTRQFDGFALLPALMPPKVQISWHGQKYIYLVRNGRRFEYLYRLLREEPKETLFETLLASGQIREALILQHALLRYKILGDYKLLASVMNKHKHFIDEDWRGRNPIKGISMRIRAKGARIHYVRMPRQGGLGKPCGMIERAMRERVRIFREMYDGNTMPFVRTIRGIPVYDHSKPTLA